MSRNFGFAPHFRSCDATAAAGEHRQPRSSQVPAAVSIQTARVGLSGGNLERPLSRHGARNTGAELSSLFPAGSILEPLDAIDALADISPTVAVAQATIDFLKVFFAILLVAVTGFGLAAVFYFLFC